MTITLPYLSLPNEFNTAPGISLFNYVGNNDVTLFPCSGDYNAIEYSLLAYLAKQFFEIKKKTFAFSMVFKL